MCIAIQLGGRTWEEDKRQHKSEKIPYGPRRPEKPDKLQEPSHQSVLTSKVVDHGTGGDAFLHALQGVAGDLEQCVQVLVVEVGQ